MPVRGLVCDDSSMATRPSLPRVPRSSDRLVAGVAGGWADR